MPAHRNIFDDEERNTDACPQMRGAEDAAHDTSCLWSTCHIDMKQVCLGGTTQDF